MRAASMTTARGSAVSASSARAAAPATRRGAAVVAAAPLLRRSSNNSNLRSSILPAPRALDLDWSDPDTLIGALGGVLGLLVGIGAPLFYISRDKKDEGKFWIAERRREREKAIEQKERAWRA
jgi:hypothetical protein